MYSYGGTSQKGSQIAISTREKFGTRSVYTWPLEENIFKEKNIKNILDRKQRKTKKQT